MRVGEKEVSEQAEIVRRYADLFSREQLDALREAEDGRLRRRARAALPAAEDVRGRPGLGRARRARGRAREPRPRRARHVQGRGAAAAERAGPARGARPRTPTARSSGRSRPTRSPRFNDDRSSCSAPARSSRPSSRAIADPVERNEEEKAISLRELSRARSRRRATTRADVVRRAARRAGSSACSARSARRCRRASTPRTCAGSRRSSRRTRRSARPRSASRRSTELGFDLAAATNIKLDLDDRPQKAPRACVIASDPPRVVHLITRAQGGLHDYQAFLHEAGHALHYGGCDPALPYTFRRISRDHALTEIYSYIVEAIIARARLARAPTSASPTSRPPRTPRRPSSSRRCSSAATSRSSASSSASGRASRGRRHAGRLRGVPDRGDRASATAATRYLRDMDAGFYSADYLRAWIRSAQLRRHLIEHGRRGLVAQPGDRRAPRASCSARARSRRARRSPRGSASTRSTRARSSPRSTSERVRYTPRRPTRPIRLVA